MTLAAARIRRGALAAIGLVVAALVFETVLIVFGRASGALAFTSTFILGVIGARDASGALTDAAPLVLVADDSPVNQLLAVRLLDQCGYRSQVVGDGHEAIAAVARTTYAAVLMDCQMPELDGYAATAVIRRREQGRERVPIIAMTANSMAGDREKCLAAGMDDYVSKPLRPNLLRDALARCLPSPGDHGESSGAGAREPDEITGELLDRSTLAELRELQADDLRELIELYLDDATPQLLALVEALERADPSAAAASAHRLKGASLAVGAALVAAIAAELEIRATGRRRGGRREAAVLAGTRADEYRRGPARRALKRAARRPNRLTRGQLSRRGRSRSSSPRNL